MKTSFEQHTDNALRVEAIGIDIGDRFSYYCALDNSGTPVKTGRFQTTLANVLKLFLCFKPTPSRLKPGHIRLG